MNVSVAKRYARALVETAATEGTLEDTGSALREVVSALSDPSIAAALASPLLKPSVRLQMLDRVSDLLQVSPLVRKFVALVSERGRVEELRMISLHYRRLADERLGRLRGLVTAPAPLPAQWMDGVQKQLETSLGKSVLLEQETDPSLLAGASVEIEGRVFDGSLRTQLARLAEALARGEPAA